MILSHTEWPGEKGPVICLSSLAGHKGAFAAIARQLAPAYHLVALDLRGRGDSAKPDQGYGFAYHARDILQFADRMGWGTFAIIGHSFGATTGVYLASVRPERVRAIVLIDGGADPKADVLEAMRPALRRLDRVYPSMTAYLEAMAALPFYSPWTAALEQYLRAGVDTKPDGTVQAKASAQGLEHDLDLHFYYSMCLHFPNMGCPALFLRPEQGLLGNQGHVFSREEAAAIVNVIPNCRRVDLPEVNHYTMVLHDNPPVIPPIRAFFEEIL
jgi:pimeloyl-ACP methyl ester carboxylesterase